jgi:hypothetical protein
LPSITLIERGESSVAPEERVAETTSTAGKVISAAARDSRRLSSSSAWEGEGMTAINVKSGRTACAALERGRGL